MTTLINLNPQSELDISSERSTTCDDEWLQFCNNNYTYEVEKEEQPGVQMNESKNVEFIDLNMKANTNVPESSDIYISTKTANYALPFRVSFSPVK